MKKVECIFRPEKLEAVKEALGRLGVNGMTVTEVRGCGLQGGQTGTYRGQSYAINLLPKVKLEVVVRDDLLASVMDVIQWEARTGAIGDGKIFVYPVEEARRIRTGESGEAALS